MMNEWMDERIEVDDISLFVHLIENISILQLVLLMKVRIVLDAIATHL